VSDDSCPVQELWSHQSGFSLQDKPLKELQAWQLCPDNIPDLRKFARVFQDGESREWARRKKLIHLNPVRGMESVRVPVTLRVQGFVSSRTLAPLGSWDA
jgi:hypothetical protein